MARTADQLATEALTLPADERARLARVLITSLDDDEVDEDVAVVEAAWAAEIDRRDQELDADPSLARPAHEVFADAEHRLQETRARRREGDPTR